MRLTRRDLARSGGAAAALAGFGMRPARAEGSSAPNVVVFCDPALRAPFEALDAPFRAAGGGRLNVFSNAPWMMLAQIERVTQTDILVAAAPVMDEAAARGLILPASRVSCGRNRLCLACRAPAPRPGEGPAAIGDIIGGGPLAVPDATSLTTLDGAAALAALGVTAPYGFAVSPAADAEDVAFLLAEGQAGCGLLHVTEALGTPGLAVAARLPSPVAAPYVAAVTMVARSPNAARFLQFLATPQARQRLQAAGLEDVA